MACIKNIEIKLSKNMEQKVSTIISKEMVVGEWITITQKKIDGFAEIGGEYDWLHNEPDRCLKESPFAGKTIVQGNFLLSIHTAFVESLALDNKYVKYGLNYGYNRIRFVQPVTVGSKVRATILLKEIIPKSETTCIITCDVTTEIKDNDSPALVADWLFYVQLN
ncbi:MAG: MaoC/PaaZ C-terminal domain-containing protein [Pseudomonadota bacterium]